MQAKEFYEKVNTKLFTRGFVGGHYNGEVFTADVHAVCKRNKVTITVGTLKERFKLGLDFTGQSETLATASTLTAKVMAYLAEKDIKFRKGELSEVTLSQQELDDIKSGKVKTWR